MDEVILFAKGIAIGVAIAAPVGPVGILVLRRSLLHGMGAGMVTGAGAAVVDAALVAAIGFGLAAASAFIERWRETLELGGGVFLLVIGWWVWRTSPPRELRALPPAPRRRVAFITAAALTASNPMTVLGISGILVGFRVAAALDTGRHVAALSAGVLAGSLLWWLILSGSAGLFREKADGTWMRRINQGCGIALVAVGAAQLAALAFGAG